MADIFDQASDREQLDRDMAIMAARHSAMARALQPAGACYNCADPVEGGLLFCDGDCRDDYQARQQAMRRN